MTNAIATATSAPQFIHKELAIPADVLKELGLPLDFAQKLPMQIPVQPPASETAARTRQAVAQIIGPAVVAGSSAAAAYLLGTSAIGAGFLQQFPADVTLAAGAYAGLATASGAYALYTLRHAAASAYQVPRLGMGRLAPQWIRDIASDVHVGVKSAFTFVSSTVTGAAVALAGTAVGTALWSGGAALADPKTWIAAGVGAVAAVGTFLLGRATLKAANELVARAAAEIEPNIEKATIAQFKQQVIEYRAEVARQGQQAS